MTSLSWDFFFLTCKVGLVIAPISYVLVKIKWDSANYISILAYRKSHSNFWLFAVIIVAVKFIIIAALYSWQLWIFTHYNFTTQKLRPRSLEELMLEFLNIFLKTCNFWHWIFTIFILNTAETTPILYPTLFYTMQFPKKISWLRMEFMFHCLLC